MRNVEVPFPFHGEHPLREQLESIVAAGLAELSVPATDSMLRAMALLAELTSSWGARINLTGHAGPDAIVRRLVLDAAALLTVLPVVPTVADLGSGAGFPGLPLAIIAPERLFTLVEARERRHHFQRHAVRALGLENVVSVRGRFEDIEPSPCDLVIAQAVGSPDDAELVTQMARWAKPCGTLAVPGGEPRGRSGPNAGIRRWEVVGYQVPLGGPARTVWLAACG